jgi:Uma2 family endonuclease
MKAGVREYWLIEPKSKTVQFFVLQNNTYAGTAYDSTAAPPPPAVLEGLSITLRDIFSDAGNGE